MFVDKVRMIAPRFSRRTTFTATFATALIFGSFAAEARPPTPQNFRVTARTAYTVSVAWNQGSGGGNGNFDYHLSGAYGVTPVVLPKTATSYTFTALYPGNQYWFFVYAQDSAGGTSGQANASTTTLVDTTPPSTAPAVSIADVGSNYAALTWTTAQDDGPYLFYEVFVNGNFYGATGKNVTSIVLRFLQPTSGYDVLVRAYDYGNNRGPMSTPLSLTTSPRNPSDRTAPTAPANLNEEHWGGGDTEIDLNWTQSIDDFDAQANIRYDVYVNGVAQDVVFGATGRSIVYGQPGQNIVDVFATDTAGNASKPATVVVFFNSVFTARN